MNDLDRLIELCMKHGKDNLNPKQCEVCEEITNLKSKIQSQNTLSNTGSKRRE